MVVSPTPHEESTLSISNPVTNNTEKNKWFHVRKCIEQQTNWRNRLNTALINVKYLRDIRRVRQNTTLYYDVMCHRTDNEIHLLNKGPKYNLHSRKHNWLSTLALEAENRHHIPPYLWSWLLQKAGCQPHWQTPQVHPTQKHTPRTQDLKINTVKTQKRLSCDTLHRNKVLCFDAPSLYLLDIWHCIHTQRGWTSYRQL